jgi:hypothetical protein
MPKAKTTRTKPTNRSEAAEEEETMAVSIKTASNTCSSTAC